MLVPRRVYPRETFRSIIECGISQTEPDGTVKRVTTMPSDFFGTEVEVFTVSVHCAACPPPALMNALTTLRPHRRAPMQSVAFSIAVRPAARSAVFPTPDKHAQRRTL
jgi:hypothetical protein